MSSDQDRILVERIRKGDRDAERKLISQGYPKVSLFVRKRLGRKPEDCEDLINEIVLAVIESLRAGNFDPSQCKSLDSYVYGVTKNKIRNYFRSMNRERVVRDEPPSDSELIAEDGFQFDDEEVRKALRKCLKKQEEKYQQVLYLRYYEDLSIREISNRIGLPAPRVSERINYALKLLKKELVKKKILQYFAA